MDGKADAKRHIQITMEQSDVYFSLDGIAEAKRRRESGSIPRFSTYFDASIDTPVVGMESCVGRYRSVQMMKELRRELAAVKEKLEVITVSLQSTNRTFSRLSDVIATSTMGNEDSNRRNNSNKDNNTRDRNNNDLHKRDRNDNCSDNSSCDESSVDSDSSNSGSKGKEDEKRRRRKRRRRRRGRKCSKTKGTTENNSNSNENSGDNSSGDNSSCDESSVDSDSSNSGSNGRGKKRRRGRKSSKSRSATDNCNSKNDNSSDNNCEQTDARLLNLNKKIKDLENRSAVWEMQLQSLEGRSHAVPPQSAETIYEMQLQEQKKNNIIIFGLQENERGDVYQLNALFSNLGTYIDVENTPFFRTGKSLEKSRPLIIKLKNQEEKAEILFKAKGLKNSQIWRGVSITHDLTKQQCQAEKLKEMELKKQAAEKNCHLSEKEKSAKVWKVVGGRGTCRLVFRNKDERQNGIES